LRVLAAKPLTMQYYIVRKSNNTYYCGAFTLSGFCSEWMDCSFYDTEDSAKEVAKGLSEYHNDEMTVEKC
jgi:hypothetical protein